MDTSHTVYGLYSEAESPRVIRYIGCSRDLAKRVAMHVNSPMSNVMRPWIERVKGENVRAIVLFESADKEAALRIEAALIGILKPLGNTQFTKSGGRKAIKRLASPEKGPA
jgi:predicted GIY-YIG superfamily endonuclease